MSVTVETMQNRPRPRRRLQPHGERARYRAGCRCADCRAANATYEQWRRYRAGDRFVDAEAARAHIRALAEEGIGFKRLAALAGISEPTAWAVRSGTRQRIRKDTEAKILAITGAGDHADGANVDSTDTWRLIDELREEGFTMARIAREIGLSGRHLYIGRKRCKARHARAVRALWRKYSF